MKYLEKIEITDGFEIQSAKFGFCEAIDRFLFFRLRSFVAEYYSFYVISKEQFCFFRDRTREYGEDPEAYRKAISNVIAGKSPAGAEYIRDYACSPAFRSADNSPLPSRWCGPYIFEGEKLNWAFSYGNAVFAVPPIDFDRNRKLREEGKSQEEFYMEQGFSMHFYNENPEFGFFGKRLQ